MDRKEKLEAIKTLDFNFAYKPYHGKYVLNAEGLTFGYDKDKPLIRDFGLCIGARARLFVVGPNGRGKTTLLKLLAGALRPDAGAVTSPAAVVPGYFEQTNVQTLIAHNTVLDEIQSADAAVDPGRARFLAGLMMFEGDDGLKKISVLSGGEKSRVLLGRLIATPVNLLLLDEPTNHLDLESSDALMEAIDGFPGAVIMVTHNEMFLHALAERLIVFQGNGISIYEGDYERFLEKVGWQEEGEAGRPGKAADKDRERPNQRDLRRLRSAVLTERAKALKPLEKRADEAEAEIGAKEGELESLNQAIIEASRGQMGQEIVEISRRMHRLKKEIDFLYGELDTLTRDIEDKKAHYDRELAGLTS